MNVARFALAAAVTLVFTACGEDGKYYRLAIDATPLNSLPASCFADGQVPDPGQSTENLYRQGTVLAWDGADGAQYLDIGDFGSFDMGDAPTVRIVGLIKGSKNTFTAARIDENGTEVRRQDLTFNFTDMGATAKGTITAKSTVTCTGCGIPSCEASLPFQGRRFDPDELTITGVN